MVQSEGNGKIKPVYFVEGTPWVPDEVGRPNEHA